MSKKIIFKGSAVAIVTPFDEQNQVNLKMLDKLINFQINNGTQAILVCGTTGESATLSDEEREKVIKYTIEKINKKIPVIVGTGSNCTEKSMNLSIRAQELGADAVIIVTPYYNKTSQSGIIQHYKYIANRIELPVILYNVPSRTGLNIMPETYFELSKIENIVATKEANGDISSIIKTIAMCGDNLAVYSGNDDQTLPILASGGIGIISAFANIAPAISQKIASSIMQIDNEIIKSLNPESEKSILRSFLKSRELLIRYQDLMEALFYDVNPMPVKSALKMMNFDCGNCRLPLVGLNQECENKLRSVMMKHGLIK
ncbi:MAG: 4-hydroxy-tetrahydrodipicolinate synthase [Oscillospiraceae bacterium]|nr:4-hydroxy-tetrahydrodipicolinate synthase [Oscillospiraceae bacterium]